MEIVLGEKAFTCESGGYHFTAWYLASSKVDALIEIRRGADVVRSFLWPAYKIWNIAAHTQDIAADIDAGLATAGSDGLGGGCVAREAPNAD